MGDDLTLECFLSLLDRAEAVIDKDYLFEERDGFEYSVKGIERYLHATNAMPVWREVFLQSLF